MKRTLLVLLLVLTVSLLTAQTSFNKPGSWITFHPAVESGVVGLLQHTYRSGEAADGNDTFDFVNQGGQEIFYSFTRMTLDVKVGPQNTFTFLYQPLTIESQTKVGNNDPGYGDLQIDGVTFANGTGLNLKYGFDFWRVSWVYDFIPESQWEASAGVSLQFRNASIVFASSDGTELTVSQDLGPVPILKVKTSYQWENGFFAGLEVDGFYASSAFFNGDSFPFTGYIWDAAARVGYDVNDYADLFLTFRLLGGGAEGTSGERTLWTQSASPTAFNHLSAYTFTLGARIK